MGNISQFASHQILDSVLGCQYSFFMESLDSFYIGFSTTPIGEDGVGATEPTFDPNYIRLRVPRSGAGFSEAGAPLRTIRTIIEDVGLPSTLNWGNVIYFMIFDAPLERNDIQTPNRNGGSLWFYGRLDEAVNIQEGDSLWLKPNSCEIILDICGGSTDEMRLSSYASNALLNYIFRLDRPMFFPPNFYVGLSSTAITASGGNITEPPVNSGYMRLELPNNKDTFANASNKQVTVAQIFKFPIAITPWVFS